MLPLQAHPSPRCPPRPSLPLLETRPASAFAGAWGREEQTATTDGNSAPTLKSTINYKRYENTGACETRGEMSNKALFLAEEAVQGKPQEFMAGLAKSSYQEKNSPPY